MWQAKQRDAIVGVAECSQESLLPLPVRLGRADGWHSGVIGKRPPAGLGKLPHWPGNQIDGTNGTSKFNLWVEGSRLLLR
jgi:hypothetical protein